ncbi:Predicted dithiol-disulfide isomerase, DsbA family [Geosporobacter subterraneus DSM 17957]|uniref:Predicted dithiol-disulfide isomerase, DsbA family n=1 Tax=Geosporobacter subterraneus DSM 17957 TaxID=1121919 RepID=A0A1M6FVY2_9FIRM|nr:DsbA family protein [Geosporobacter subterraneus]SHJ01827.1 Predicted dithiol-disulfide isomerase, DsbA family [Geosporobacter subterraneus DSM 17957]
MIQSLEGKSITEPMKGVGLLKEIIFIFDYICPYCYLMLPEIERLYSEHRIKVSWIPTEIYPEIPPEGTDLKNFLGTRKVEKAYKLIKAQAKKKNLVFYLPERIYNTRLARMLTAYAFNKVPMEEILHAFYNSVFVYNKNIGDHRVLQKICLQLGISWDDFLQRMEDEHLLAVIGSWEDMIKPYSVEVVPTIASGENILAEGVCSYEELVKMINK